MVHHASAGNHNDMGLRDVRVELAPDLSHCVETVAKRKYREIVGSLLVGTEPNEERARQVELLRVFLETADFKELRMESERHLMAGRHVAFVLRLEGGTLNYKLDATQSHA